MNLCLHYTMILIEQESNVVHLFYSNVKVRLWQREFKVSLYKQIKYSASQIHH